MNKTSFTSPYLSAHPEFSSLLAREKVDLRTWVDEEYGEFLIYDEGRLVWSSGEKRLTLLSIDHHADFFYRDIRPLQVLLSYTRFVRGRSFRAVVRMSPPRPIPNQRGRAQLRLNVTSQNPSPVRIARRRVAGMFRRTSVRRSGFRASSPLRPNVSITVAKAFLVETDTGLSSFVSPQFRYSRTWTGVRTPGFGRLKKSQLPVNPHTVAILDVEQDVLVEIQDWRRRPTDRFFRVDYGTMSHRYPVPALPSHLTTARNTAIQRLINKAESGIQANLAQDLAQISQTTSLIGQNALKIAQSLTQLRRRNFSGAIQTLWSGQNPRFRRSGQPSFTRSLANNWLQLQYGWKPLLQDIEGSLTALSRLALSSQPFVQRVTASASADSTFERRFAQAFAYPDPGPSGIEVTHTQTRVKMAISYVIASPLQSFLGQTGFTNPINLLWEILPFSFVVDWFTGIGPYLESLSAWDGLVFRDGSETKFTRQIAVMAMDYRWTPSASESDLVEECDKGTYRRTGLLLDRSRLTSFPRQNYVPTFRNGLASITHATNAIALVKSVFGR
jgi:hypothetical protein